MIAFQRLLSPQMWIIVGLSVALFASGVGLYVKSANLRTCEAEKKTLLVQVDVQNDKIARWEKEADRQKKLVDKGAALARSAGQKWQARIDAAKNERPAVKSSDGPLAVCEGSMKWGRDKENSLSRELNQ